MLFHYTQGYYDLVLSLSNPHCVQHESKIMLKLQLFLQLATCNNCNLTISTFREINSQSFDGIMGNLSFFRR